MTRIMQPLIDLGYNCKDIGPPSTLVRQSLSMTLPARPTVLAGAMSAEAYLKLLIEYRDNKKETLKQRKQTLPFPQAQSRSTDHLSDDDANYYQSLMESYNG
jgi:hypothetical protein